MSITQRKWKISVEGFKLCIVWRKPKGGSVSSSSSSSGSKSLLIAEEIKKYVKSKEDENDDERNRLEQSENDIAACNFL